jgi:hypothetical protein
VLEAIGATPWWAPRARFEQDSAAARESLGESVFAAARAEGRAMTLDQAIAYALDEPASI